MNEQKLDRAMQYMEEMQQANEAWASGEISQEDWLDRRAEIRNRYGVKLWDELRARTEEP